MLASLWLGHGWHGVLESVAIALAALLAGQERWGRRFCAVAATLGLMTSSAILVHLSGGYIEMHFHFFVMVGIITLYQDWTPFLLAISYVIVHHGMVGVLHPSSVYNHADAWAHPWRWAAIHGSFVLAASAASLTAWRLNEYQAMHDPLTEAANRARFNKSLTQAIARAGRSGELLGVIFFDLDGFKRINDTAGHEAGDAVLVVVAERLRRTVRGGDTLARMGGDEFAVLLEHLRDPEDAVLVAKRILSAFETPIVFLGQEIRVQGSLGIAVNLDPLTDPERLVRSADLAMYAAKARGRGCYEVAH